MDKNYLVTKSNYFIMNSSYDLSLEEQKVILTLASMVQPEDEDFKSYKFRIADFRELLGVEDKSKYTEIPKITKELMKKVFEIQEGDTLIQTAWLSGARYKKGSGEVELTFSSYLKPYMIKLSSMFTQYKLANILSMKSKYSPRMYEILKCNEFKKQGFIEIAIDDLRKLIKADNVYPLYADFKRKVIIQTQKELKKISDISFEFEEIKTGRKVTSLKFYIKSNKSTKAKVRKEPTALDEVSATVSEDIEQDLKEGVEIIVNMMKEHKISPAEALAIHKSSNGDMIQIAKVYEHFRNKEAANFVALMIKMVKPNEFREPRTNNQKTGFNNFDGREYDYKELEQQLLGFD